MYVFCNYVCVYIYINTLRAHHQECIFDMRMRPQKRALVAAPFEHKPTDSQTHSPLPNCEETNCNGLCLGRHVAPKQARGVEPPRRPRYPKLLLLKPACKYRITPLPSVLTPLVRPITPLQPGCKEGITSFTSVIVPITPLQPACK